MTNSLPDPDIERGDALRDSGALDEAAGVYREVIAAKPDSPLGHYKLGTALTRLGRNEEAANSYGEALRLAPDHPEAANNLGILLVDQGQTETAEALFRNALTVKIDYLEAHLNLGDLLAKAKRRVEAMYHYQRAIALRPDSATAKEKLGVLLFDMDRIDDAITELQAVVKLDPLRAHAWACLARCHSVRAEHAEAERCNHQAIELDSTLTAAWLNLAFGKNNRNGDKEEAFQQHVSLGRHMLRAAAEPPIAKHSNAPNIARRLRIGFVSGDLRRHSVSHFIEGPLAKINRNQIETWAYYNYPTEDYRTQELKSLFDEWRNIYGVKADLVAKVIVRDAIDILIDLAGPTGHTRLDVFALKPAPIQLSWIGYPNTTGLSTIDYRLTDAWVDPLGQSEAFHTEQLLRLPECFLCYSPPKEAPSVIAPPCVANGYVTFGSFNTRAKIGAETLALWDMALKAVPNSRLLLKSVAGFRDNGTKNHLLEQIRNAGMDPTRVTILPPEDSVMDHLAKYALVDIGLDTYPYHGTTTTCEALWMGVPVLTVAGDRHASRVGLSLMANLGLRDLVADNAEDFVRIAVALAADKKRLAELRTTMRERMLASPLLNGTAMARNIESVFRNLWVTYCDAHPDCDDANDQVDHDRLIVNLSNAVRISVSPNVLTDMTSWALLEQEDWFEDEIGFVRSLCTSAWHALDIGANHGVYSLTLANSGAAKIWAFEPVSEPRLRLRDSVALNQFEDRISVQPAGLSATSAKINIALARYSELNSLNNVSDATNGHEVITILPLDTLTGKIIPNNPLIDFVKLDAEGEEVAIIRGGLTFFSGQSPLVMFEYKHQGLINSELIAIFRFLGYRIYRLISALGCLVHLPEGAENGLDGWSLNLFACKPDRAGELSKASRLVDLPIAEDIVPKTDWLETLFSMPALTGVAAQQWRNFACDTAYGKALLSWCGSRQNRLPAPQRLKLLNQALEHIQIAIDEQDAHPAVALLAIRICSDIGLRTHAISIANAFAKQMTPDEDFPLDRPLPPAYVAFDNRKVHASLEKFLYQSVIEFLVDRSAHSLFFHNGIGWLIERGLNNPEHTPRLERSAVLLAARKGSSLQLNADALLFRHAPDNLNPGLWQELVRQFAARPRNDSPETTAIVNQVLEIYRSGRAAEALARAEAALKQTPASAALMNAAASAAKALGDLEKAETLWRAAIATQTDYAEAHNDLGILLLETKRYEAAEAAYRRALEIRPDYAEAQNNLGLLLMETKRFEAAEAAYRAALKIQPDNALVYNNLGVLLMETKRFKAAQVAFRRVLKTLPDFGNAVSGAYHCASHLCDWARHSEDEARLVVLVNKSVSGISPFVLLTLETGGADIATLQYRSGYLSAESDYQVQSMPTLVNGASHPRRKRLRIGYLSADFHEHATLRLLRGVLASHDRTKFKIHCYSCGTVYDAMTRRTMDACDVFRDMKELSDQAAAELIAADGIDLLVDLKGFTQGTRLEITARRPAPVIVSWLGYPGTLGHPRLADYIIGDPIVTPPEHAAHFSETLALMPHCYQPNDRERVIGKNPGRAEAGLPEKGFVFCCFNGSFKFDPVTFDLWCRLLLEVPDSVLWLLEPTAPAIANLRREAKAHGLDADRLIFAPMKPPAEHLGRLQLADLALDTFPYTSHTTASDALWAGVPMVTRIGGTFASRVAASLLNSSGLPELITQSPDDYFALAKSLAINPKRLVALRRKLAESRLITPLFDTLRFTADLEHLYARIWAQHTNGIKEIILPDDLNFNRQQTVTP